MNVLKQNTIPRTRVSCTNMTLPNTVMIAHPAISNIIVCEIQDFPHYILDSKDDINCLMTPPTPPPSPCELLEDCIEDEKKEVEIKSDTRVCA